MIRPKESPNPQQSLHAAAVPGVSRALGSAQPGDSGARATTHLAADVLRPVCLNGTFNVYFVPHLSVQLLHLIISDYCLIHLKKSMQSEDKLTEKVCLCG